MLSVWLESWSSTLPYTINSCGLYTSVQGFMGKLLNTWRCNHLTFLFQALCMNAPKTQSRLEILITRFETRDSRWKIENLNWPIIYKNHVSERPRPCLACYNMKKKIHSPCWIIPNLLIPFCLTNPFPLWFSKTISNSFISCLRKRLLC